MSKRLTVAVRLTGGLGDVLLASPFLEALHSVLEGPRIAVFYHTPAVAQFVFGGSRFVHVFGTHVDLQKAKGLSGYDLLVHTGHFPRYQILNQRTVNFAPPEFLKAMKVSNDRVMAVAGLVTAHPKLDGFWARHVTAKGWSYLDGVGWLSGLPVSRDSHPCLSLDPTARVSAHTTAPYITVHDGFDVRQLPKAGQATKCWGIKQWTELVRELKATLPNYRVVQLGAGKSRRIPGVDACLVDQTTLAQTAWLLKDAALHIDTDSGLAHLARALHTPAVVMFGPTNAQYFGHKENSNLAPSACGDCWWSMPDWLAKCPRGLVEPECMASISVEQVMRAVAMRLSWRLITLPDLQASALTCYDGMDDGTQSLADMIAELGAGVPRGPITQHIVHPETGVYVHASKQWEYTFALKAMPAAVAGLKVADVGGGRGALAPYLARLGADVIQFDRDYEWSKVAASEADYRRWAKSNGYEARYGSVYNLPAADSSYDVVLCISVLEHLPEKTAALRELLRILRPGGVLILTFDYASEPARYRDKFRLDVFGADSLEREMHLLGCTDFVGASDLTTGVSAELIHRDAVLGIPEGMTVAGLTISKSKAGTDISDNGTFRALAGSVTA